MTDTPDHKTSVRLGWGQVATIASAIVLSSVAFGYNAMRVEQLADQVDTLRRRLDKFLLRSSGEPVYDAGADRGSAMIQPGPAILSSEGKRCDARSVGGPWPASAPMPAIAPTSVASEPSEAVTGGPVCLSRLKLHAPSGCCKMYGAGRPAAPSFSGGPLQGLIIRVL